MFKFSLLFLTLIISCFSFKKQYSDYSLVRFHGVNGTDVESFLDKNIDVWAQNLLGDSWADVMLHADQLDQFLDQYPNYEIVYDNVQTELDRHDAEMASRPEGALFFDYFPTYDEVSAWLDEQIGANSGVARSISLGRTYQGTVIRGVQLGTVSSAPYFYIHCTIHAREWITTTTCCWIIEQLLTVDKDLLSQFNWIIVPVLNIDGYQYSHNSDRLWRKNRQPNTGSTCVGTDLNRNYRIGFGGPGSSNNPCSETFRGVSAFSGPETSAESSYLGNYASRTVAYVDIHAYGAYFMSPWGYTTTAPPDYSAMNSYMVTATNAIRGVNGRSYAYGSSAVVIYVASGGSDDWSYGEYKIIPSFTVEAYGSSFTPPVSYIQPIGEEIYAGIKALAGRLGK